MKKEDVLCIWDNADITCKDFLNLCDKAKALIYDYINRDNEAEEVLSTLDCYGLLQYSISPIEQIFYISFYLYCLQFYELNDLYDYSVEFGIPIHAMLMEEITPQKKVKYLDKTYIVDFVIDFSKLNLNGQCVYPKLNKLKYAIELDGFDYHSKKDQMNYDYHRENNLKLLGYNVIRFTGSQVFNSPYSCFDTLISLIMKDINLCLSEDKYGK